MLLLALAPTILVGLLLGSYFTFTRIHDLEETLVNQAIDIAEPLALATEPGFSSADRTQIKHIITAAQQKKSTLIKAIAVFTAQNINHVTTSYHREFELMRLKGPVSTLKQTQIEHIGNALIVRTPVLSHEHDFSEAPKPEHILGYVSMHLNKEHIMLAQHRSAVAAFIIVLLGVQLNLFFSFKLVRSVTRPISQMVDQVARIRKGELDARIDEELIGELNSLKLGINDMAMSLYDYHQEMQNSIDQATSDLRQTIEQIEIQNVELDIAKRKAETASQIKTDFLANMSHELRTPLNGIIGFTRQLQKTQLHRSQRDYLRTIENSARNLLTIINDILDLSKLEADKMTIEHLPFSLYECVEQAVDLLSPAAVDKRLELVVEMDPSIPESLCGDSMRIGQVISNLVANAIKFTDDGVVKVTLKAMNQEGEKLYIRGEIKDSGIGISTSQQEQLFQAFNQADSSITRRYGGTGLGLAICKRLVSKMGGQIGFSSTPRVGSTFWFSLPLTSSPYAIKDLMPAELLSGKRVLLYQPLDQTRQVMAAALAHYQLQVSAFTQPSQLEQQLNQEQSFDYAILAVDEFYDSLRAGELLTRAQAISPRLILTHHNQDLSEIEGMLRRDQDCLMSLPVIHKQLIANMLYPGGQPAESSVPLASAEPVEQAYVMSEPKAQGRVLAVDDNPSNLKLIKTLLEELVTEVVTVSSGNLAIRECRQREFDVIFMDIQMPGIDGLSATRVIRSVGQNRTTPIIAVTAHTLAEEKHKYLGSGMDDYLAKPIDEPALRSTLAHWMAKGHSDQKPAQLAIDWTLALAQANNDPALAQDMVRMLADSLPSAHQDIEAALSSNDTQAGLQSVHKLHGASCYAGVAPLQRQCADVETALKQGQTPEDLEPELLELLDEIIKVESAAAELLESLTLPSDSGQ